VAALALVSVKLKMPVTGFVGDDALQTSIDGTALGANMPNPLFVEFFVTVREPISTFVVSQSVMVGLGITLHPSNS
jgi:hypothetical protein